MSIRRGGLPERPFATACFLQNFLAQHKQRLTGKWDPFPAPALGAVPTTCHRAFPELISLFSWDLIKRVFILIPSLFFSLLFIRFLFQLFVASK